jgi:hypothetical protein
MASGQTLLHFESSDATAPRPDYVAATPDVRNGHPVLDFDAVQHEYAEFNGMLPRHYGGAGITFMFVWSATLATSGQIVWAVQFERNAVIDGDIENFGPWAGSAEVLTSPEPGVPTYTDVVVAPAGLGGILPGEHFRIRVARYVDYPPGYTPPPFVGDAELWSIELRET